MFARQECLCSSPRLWSACAIITGEKIWHAPLPSTPTASSSHYMPLLPSFALHPHYALLCPIPPPIPLAYHPASHTIFKGLSGPLQIQQYKQEGSSLPTNAQLVLVQVWVKHRDPCGTLRLAYCQLINGNPKQTTGVYTDQGVVEIPFSKDQISPQMLSGLQQASLPATSQPLFRGGGWDACEKLGIVS